MDLVVFAVILGCMLIIAGVFDIKWLLDIFAYHNPFRELFGSKGFRYICIIMGSFLIICVLYDVSRGRLV